ncbi:MAG: hypothetical protein LQ350_005977 [Teloschistes chrysophthalmus]|nr:MAG: hypothetical protein LQ350_005977 [Niorma chrysophthalma]
MSSRSASLSPPPLKRRRMMTPPKASPSIIPLQIPNISLPQSTSDSAKRINLRIYSWNINGIAPYLDQQRPITKFFPAASSATKSHDTPSPPSLRACLHRWSFPHIIFLQEVKIAPSDTSSQTSVRRIINVSLNDNDPTNSPDRLYDAYFSLPRDRHNATGFGGKVYGVCMLLRRDIASFSTIRIPDWDLEGRVQILELRKYGTVVFNVYAVNGTTNPYRDPSTGKVIGDRHMRKRQLHDSLHDECLLYRQQGWHFAIAGDINISQTPLDSYPQLRMGKEHVVNREHFKECFLKVNNLTQDRGLGMRDSFRELRGEESKYSYRPPGKIWGEGMDRVDLILVSQKVILKGADILDSPEERGTSDHVPLWVEVNVEDMGETDEEKGVREVNGNEASAACV